jgi:anti-anti-sigma factor
MPIYNLDATVTYQPQIAIIKLEGEINNLAEQVLDRSFSEAEKSSSSYILLNFTGVRYMNSSGIALVVGLIGRARRANKHLLACGLSQHFVEIFQVTRLSDFIKIYPDEISIYTDPALNVRV